MPVQTQKSLLPLRGMFSAASPAGKLLCSANYMIVFVYEATKTLEELSK